uniref:ALG11 mannosyltransferase N-terminal domain-containing protein n=1 Tax=Acrobeloides nanus TaxID=290746 RepID=A0A914DCZ2_9BILA
MIGLVESRTVSYNNDARIAYNGLLTNAKVLYYRMFALLYRLCGMCSNVVMVNGSWTENHINELWKVKATKVYPPCDVAELLALPKHAEKILSSENRINILSIGQIRPEKNYPLQLETISEVKKRLADYNSHIKVRLLITGSCRHEEDMQRAKMLKEQAEHEFGLTDEDVEWNLNVTIDRLRE